MTEMGRPNIDASLNDRQRAIYVHVGARIRQQRMQLGLSQEQLGRALKISSDQLQAYEQGQSRVGPTYLFDLARILDVSIDFFFDDMSDDLAGARVRGTVNPSDA